MQSIENYKIIDGVKCYAPEILLESHYFPKENYEALYKLEEKNFWFLSRNRILLYFFNKFLHKIDRAKILEIGCGTGFVLKALSKLNKFDLYGAELYLEGLKFAKSRLEDIEFFQMDARDIPFENKFDAIGAFDVLEHVEEDWLIVKSAFKALKAGGLFFITVPQHKFLWSRQDEASFHKRRYSKKELTEKLYDSGFTIEFISSFVFTLLPMMLIARLQKKKKNSIGYDFSELDLPQLTNNICNLLMSVDEFMIKRGISLPVGGSLLVIARK